MATCRFCQRQFQSDQAVKAHLKHCVRYEAKGKTSSPTLGSVPKGSKPQAAVHSAHMPQGIASFNFQGEYTEKASVENEPAETSATQQRRKILQEVKTRVIDEYRPPQGTATASMRGAAKTAIEREFETLSFEEWPFEEVIEHAVGIRDRLYTIKFKRQAREVELQEAKAEARRIKDLKEFGNAVRANRRKSVLIQQVSRLALASCEERKITG